MQKKLKTLQPKIAHLFQVRSWKHPFAVPFITFSVLIVLTVGIYLIARQTNRLPPVHDAKIVIISHDKQQQIVPSKEDTVGELLKKLHLTLNQGDVVEPALSTHIDQDQFRINIYRAVPVAIVDGGHKTYTYSAAKTPRAIAQQAGTAPYAEDQIADVPADNFFRTGVIGKQVVVDRSFPINMDLYGTHLAVRTHAKTVREFMKEKHIVLLKKDQVSPGLDAPIGPGQQISFIRTGVKVETVTEDIAMPVQKVNDPTLAYGTSAVRQQGADGQQVVTYQVQLVNNVETGRTVLQKVVSKQPVTQVVVIGTSLSGIKGDMALAGISPDEFNSADYVISRESHWNPGAVNGGGCAGLGQACPGSKLAGACPNWQNDPVCQLRYFTGYASKYGGWNGAAAYWRSHGWW